MFGHGRNKESGKTLGHGHKFSQQRTTVCHKICHKTGVVSELSFKEDETDRKSWKVGWSQGTVESRLFFDMSMSKKTHFGLEVYVYTHCLKSF